jgi:DNA-binding PadR family transcriptional regulator
MRGFNHSHQQSQSDRYGEASTFAPSAGRPRRDGGQHGPRRRGHGRNHGDDLQGDLHHEHGHDEGAERGRSPRGRTRRGEIRTVLLAILADGPGHGYDLIQRIEAKTSGAWKPSPGSVYPTLQLLQDEGFVTMDATDGKRTFELTENGRVEAQRRLDNPADNPWTREGRGRSQAGALFEPMKGLVIALKQISMSGNPQQVEAATEIVKEARRKLYLLLAEE